MNLWVLLDTDHAEYANALAALQTQAALTDSHVLGRNDSGRGHELVKLANTTADFVSGKAWSGAVIDTATAWQRAQGMVFGPQWSASGDKATLLAQANGFAEDVTGGNAAASPTYVTNLNNSGTGSLRAALEATGAAYVVFLVSGTLTLSSQIDIRPNKTIDGRGVSISITGQGIWWNGTDRGTTTANLIFAYLSFDHATSSTANDAIRCVNGGDLGWVYHCDFADGTDGLIDITLAGGNATRWTIDWNKFGPHPGAQAYALGGSNDDGKQMLIGAGGDSSNPDSIQVTRHHNYSLHNVQRQPRMEYGRCHAYNEVVEHWGKADGSGSVAMEVNNGGELLAENCVFNSYTTGNVHWTDAYEDNDGTTTVTSADKEAVKVAGTGGALSSSGHLLQNSETEADDTGTVFTPGYSYTAETASTALKASVIAGAGNVQLATAV